MSKKKGSGHTMTLKDFHGGSIPTDLPLPSAPGVMPRPLERSGFERPSPWGIPVGRSDHRSRPHSSPAMKPYDDKSPFLSPTVHIGRNFDEDERKPLDGVAPPRRTISDESFRVPPSPMELKLEYGSNGRQALTLGSQVSSLTVANSYSGSDKINGGSNWGVSLQKSGGSGSHGFTGVQPNVWQSRKEVITGSSEPANSAWAKPAANSKLANASALEKVSSGKWQSKQSIHYQIDGSSIGFSEQAGNLQSEIYDINSYNRMDLLSGMEYYHVTLANSVEKGNRIYDGNKGQRQELPQDEQVELLKHSTLKESNSNMNFGFQRAPFDENADRSELQPAMAALPAGRPKLKLLPRTKPLEVSETSPVDYANGYQPEVDSGPSETVQINRISVKPGSAGEDSGNQAVERPKLTLKPRSQPMKHVEQSIVTERSSLFGGARPRELVLKERGHDDVSVNGSDFNQNSERTDQIVPSSERVQRHMTPNSAAEKTESHPPDQRFGGKQGEWKKDHRIDMEKSETERKNWRNDNRRSHKEAEKQQPVDRPPSPETWRKAVDQPTPASSDASTGVRYGKAASAIELAQAFSRSVSEPKKADSVSGGSGLRSLPSRTQTPFSRLMGPTPRPQINGY